MFRSVYMLACDKLLDFVRLDYRVGMIYGSLKFPGFIAAEIYWIYWARELEKSWISLILRFQTMHLSTTVREAQNFVPSSIVAIIKVDPFGIRSPGLSGPVMPL